jgi:5-oxoprolinase (ATP-hydrolysing)
MRLVGVDVGGTFTDLVLFDPAAPASTRVVKVPTTPTDPSDGFARGLQELLGKAGIGLEDVGLLSHGATIATNALLEHRGARVGLITTRGFRDVVHLARHQRPLHYSIMQEIPWQDRPLVRRRFREVVDERISPPSGEVLVPLNEAEVRAAAERLRDAGVEAVAICFLFSYLNSEHERRARQIVEEVCPGVFVTTSSDTVSQFREFERFTTTCINAFVGPAVRSYLDRLDGSLREGGLKRPLHVMRSNGGVATASTAAEVPATMLLSGPAAGVVGGAWAGENEGRRNVITLDVGGTSSDVGIVTDGQAAEAKARETWIAGYPLLLPVVDLHTIGAGGGSVAFVDSGGAFRVGPRSAGADPGPAAYGRGGVEATVTDAHLVLGRLDPAHLLGGHVGLREELAHGAIERLAEQVGLPVLEAAEGVLRIVNHNMVNAIRTKTVEKGIDPREYTLVALGGAGPLHAAEIAELLEIPEIIIPPFPGITSAMGLLTSDLKYDLSSTTFLRSDRASTGDLLGVLDRLESEGQALLLADGFDPDTIRLVRKLDCRYQGQGYELSVELSPLKSEQLELEQILAAFHQLHEREYGYAFPDNVVEIVTARVTAVGRMPKLHAPGPAEGLAAERVPARTQPVHFRVDGRLESFDTPLYRRDSLAAGLSFEGPAIILQTDSTTVVPLGWAAHVEPSGNLILSQEITRSAAHRGEVPRDEHERTDDPVTSRVIAGALQQAAIEVGYKLSRMAYSSLIRESEDFGVALLDVDGVLLCQSEQSTPLQHGPLPGYLEGIRQIFAQRGLEFEKGDVIVHNSAYHGASHVPDVGICVPVFAGGELIGFSLVAAHLLDIGANAPGTSIIDAVDAYAEGIQLKALKLFEKGTPNQQLWYLLRDNLRASDLVVGDIEALVAAARIGAARFLELAETHGLAALRGAGRDAIAYSERMLRAEIEKLPDGKYVAEGWIDGYQDHDDPGYKNLKVQVSLEIKGSEITVDLAGTSPQLDNLPINMPLRGTVDVAVWLTIRSILLDSALYEDVPQNDGLLRPIRIIAPEGTMANPTYPAPTIARFCSGSVVADTVMRALAQVMPQRVSGGVGILKNVNYIGMTDGNYWVHLDNNEGAYGGRFGKDGMDAVDTLYANTRNTPIEDIESHFPLRVERYELAEDRAGAGKWRGGFGAIRDVTFLQDGLTSAEGEGNVFAPPGLFGGLPGAPGELVRNPGRSDETHLPSKIFTQRVPKGTTIRQASPCGGGYGDPIERQPELVREDVIDGLVSLASAERLYGVVIDPHSLKLDTTATESLRASRHADRLEVSSESATAGTATTG